MIKNLIASSLFLASAFTYAGNIVEKNESVEIKQVNDTEFFTKYCVRTDCVEGLFNSSEFSEEMDLVTEFIEKMYDDEDFYESHIKNSFDNYKEKELPIWILDFSGLVVFSVKESEYQEVIKAKGNVTSMLYSFHNKINSKEYISRLKEISSSNKEISDLSIQEFLFYKSISKIMINKVRLKNV